MTAQLHWKQIEYGLRQGAKENATQWCQLALHQLLSNAGDHNIGKIER